MAGDVFIDCLGCKPLVLSLPPLLFLAGLLSDHSSCAIRQATALTAEKRKVYEPVQLQAAAV